MPRPSRSGGRCLAAPSSSSIRLAILTCRRRKQVIVGTKISALWLTAALFHQVVDEDITALAGVTNLLAGGDVVSASHVRHVNETLDGCQLINGYGPTEATTFSACHAGDAAAGIEISVPIGRPISNTQIYVLDGGLGACSGWGCRGSFT